MNCENQRYVQNILNAKIYFAKSCIWLSLTFSRYPLFLRNIVSKVIAMIPVVIIPANIYQPYSVLNQCGSKPINQSQDIIDSVTIKKTKNPAASLKFLRNQVLSSASSCAKEYFLE